MLNLLAKTHFCDDVVLLRLFLSALSSTTTFFCDVAEGVSYSAYQGPAEGFPSPFTRARAFIWHLILFI